MSVYMYKASPFKSLVPLRPHKCNVKWLHRAMFVLVTGICLAFFDAAIKFDFVLMTSAIQSILEGYRTARQHLA